MLKEQMRAQEVENPYHFCICTDTKYVPISKQLHDSTEESEKKRIIFHVLINVMSELFFSPFL